jgi:hypothetical protein
VRVKQEKVKKPKAFLLSLASPPTHLLANFNVAFTCHAERRKGKREASEVAIVGVLANGGGGEQAHTVIRQEKKRGLLYHFH